MNPQSNAPARIQNSQWSLLSTILVLSISACSSDEDNAPSMLPDTTPDTGITDTSQSEPTETTPPNDGTDLLNDMPIFNIAECGSIPAAETTFSTIQSSPAPLLLGEPVKGRIDPDSATNTEHYWNIDLEQGYYHVLIDSAPLTQRDANVGLILHEVDSLGEEIVRILRGNNITIHNRSHAFLTVGEAKTLRLNVETNHNAENYTLAIFANGSAVPTPFLSDCPTINPLSVDTTEAFELGEEVGVNDIIWFRTDLATADYNALITSAIKDGSRSNIQHNVDLFDQFAQESREFRIVRVNEIDVMAASRTPVRRSEPSPVWIRIENDRNDVDIEFTLESAN